MGQFKEEGEGKKKKEFGTRRGEIGKRVHWGVGAVL